MPGNLLIAGGNIQSRDIYKQFIELIGGKNATIALVPTATEEIDEAIDYYTDIFCEMGLKKDNIYVIEISDMENRHWAVNGDELEDVDFINQLDGVWFTGGDQSKISNAFLRKDGTYTIALDMLYRLLEHGGTIAGSSAGAAMMSEIMIERGTSAGAYKLPIYECRDLYNAANEHVQAGAMLISKGLGFFKYGIIDQHFDKRVRLGRLFKAMSFKRVNNGFGIAEDTAILYDIDACSGLIIGSGRVAVIKADFNDSGGLASQSSYAKTVIHYLEEGDIFKIQNNGNVEITCGRYKQRDEIMTINLSEIDLITGELRKPSSDYIAKEPYENIVLEKELAI